MNPPGEMLAIIRSGRVFHRERNYMLHDDGLNGDAQARDGQWVLDLTWEPGLPTGDNIQARIEMRFDHRVYEDVRGCKVKLDVEPKE